MLSEGVKIRAQIDTESVRAVMLVTGGGSVALIALIPKIMGTPLVEGLIYTLALWLLSLTLVVIHNVLRRHCSNIYEPYLKKGEQPPPGDPHFRIVCGFPRAVVIPNVPWVCWWSWRFLYPSIAFFLVGGIVMAIFAVANIDVLTATPSPS